MTKLSLLGDFGFWSKMSKTPKESWITCYVCYVYGAVAECTMHSLKDHYDHWIIVIVLVFTAIMWFWIWRVYNLSSFTVYHHVSSCIMYRHWSSVISVFMVQHYSSSFPVTPLICHHGSSATRLSLLTISIIYDHHGVASFEHVCQLSNAQMLRVSPHKYIT